jgi:restriction system protein
MFPFYVTIAGSPMPTQYPYRETIFNEYLGVSKVIRAMTQIELNWMINAQYAKWKEMEYKKKRAEEKQSERNQTIKNVEQQKTQAETDTLAAKKALNSFREILSDGISSSVAVDWSQLLDMRLPDTRVYPEFVFDMAKPDRDAIRMQLLGPMPAKRVYLMPRGEVPSPFESVLPFLRLNRLKREKKARDAHYLREEYAEKEHNEKMKEYKSREREVIAAYNSAAITYNMAKKELKEKYRNEKAEFIEKQAAYNRNLAEKQKTNNDAVAAFRNDYEKGNPEAVERYMQMVLEVSRYPEPIAGDPSFRFDSENKTLALNFWLPQPMDVPKIIEYKYVVSRKGNRSHPDQLILRFPGGSATVGHGDRRHGRDDGRVAAGGAGGRSDAPATDR